jgi:hypothetical protein
MELVARELKAQGKYLSRTLSFKGVTYETATHKLNPAPAGHLQSLLRGLGYSASGRGRHHPEHDQRRQRARGNFMSQLGGAQQRFFSVLLTTLKIPTAVEMAKKAEKDGMAVAISLINTNEASQNREKAKLSATAGRGRG